MQGWGAVEQNHVVLDDLLQHFPDARIDALDQSLRRLDVVRVAVLDQPSHHERLEEFQRHPLRQTALVECQVRTDHDNGTTGVVDALAEQVLAESSLLALEHVGEALELVLARTGDDTTTPTIVDQRVDRFLQHALLVADDDVRRTQAPAVA